MSINYYDRPITNIQQSENREKRKRNKKEKKKKGKGSKEMGLLSLTWLHTPSYHFMPPPPPKMFHASRECLLLPQSTYVLCSLIKNVQYNVHGVAYY